MLPTLFEKIYGTYDPVQTFADTMTIIRAKENEHAEKMRLDNIQPTVGAETNAQVDQKEGD